MKKIAFLLSIGLLSLFPSCDNNKSMIIKYLSERYSVPTSSINIIDISEVDSMYSPYRSLLLSSGEYSSISAGVSKLMLKASRSKTKKDAINYLDSAYFFSETPFLDSITTANFLILDYPITSSTIRPFNCTGVFSKYKLQGREVEEIFYFSKNVNSIHSSEYDCRKIAHEIRDYQRKISEYKNEIIKYKQEIIDGLYLLE